MNEKHQDIINKFHDIYYNGLNGIPIYTNTYWMGVPCLKCPLDLWIYQEIIFEIQPDLILETGTHKGGSAFFLAHILDILGKGEVITIDIDGETERPVHPRITYATGSSSDTELLASIFQCGQDWQRKMFILDSDHSKIHVLNELKAIEKYVNVEDHIIVEDTNVNGHPTYPEHGPGPFEAVNEFLYHNQRFIFEKDREKFLMTFNPKGYLKCIA